MFNKKISEGPKESRSKKEKLNRREFLVSAGYTAGFLAVGFLAAGFLAAGFLAAGFFDGGFLAGIIRQETSRL